MANVSVRDDTLVVTMEGIRRVWTLKSELTIPLAHVREVVADPGVRDCFPTMTEKRLGTNLYHRYYGGTFMQDGDRVFWDVRQPDKAIVITLDNEDFERLIVEVDDPDSDVALIREALVGR